MTNTENAMTNYQITNPKSGTDLGIYAAETPEQALEAMARDAGYDSYAEACEVAGGSELLVEEVTTEDARTIPTTEDINAMSDLLVSLGAPDHDTTTDGLIRLQTSSRQLDIYWDSQDPRCTGWAYYLRTGYDPEDGQYGLDDLASGALDGVGELRSLLALVGADAAVA